MLLRISCKELCEIARDPCAVAVLGVYIAILCWSCFAFSSAWSRQFEQQASLQHQSREAWLTQETESPHQATHEGTTVYKLPSPMANFDPGVAPEFGTVVKLESHKRHAAKLASKEDEVGLLQLNMTTPALLMQAVLPLIVIFLSHALLSQERERGTWGLVSSLGVSQLRLKLGKITGMFLLCLLLSAPVLFALIWAICNSPEESGYSTGNALGRGAALYFVSLLYLLGWIIAGTALSARFSSGTTLILLLACWAGWTLILPRLAVDLAYSRFPLPNQQSLLESREAAIRKGSNGRATLEELNEQLEKKLLEEYDVSDLADLPINLDAARLLAMEEFTDAIDDDIQTEISEIYQQQNHFLDWFEFLSPYLVVRSISSSLAGTDRHHHAVFIDSAEQYRRFMVKTMNRAEMKGELPGSTTVEARQFWSMVPEFRQNRPSFSSVCYAMRGPIGVLMTWFAMAIIIVLIPSRGPLV